MTSLTWLIMSFPLVQKIMSFPKVTLIHLTLIPSYLKLTFPPSAFKDLHPISICINIVYKIINKVLINRLRLLLDIIIGLHQSNFLSGRVLLTMLLFCRKYFTYRSQRIIIIIMTLLSNFT